MHFGTICTVGTTILQSGLLAAFAASSLRLGVLHLDLSRLSGYKGTGSFCIPVLADPTPIATPLLLDFRLLVLHACLQLGGVLLLNYSQKRKEGGGLTHKFVSLCSNLARNTLIRQCLHLHHHLMNLGVEAQQAGRKAECIR